ncbi:hypothetical protein GCWB2_12710 [Gordonia rubripertincta]|nr:hypothetical protein GCWB2_12710 [Gordonia rubripertincta]
MQWCSETTYRQDLFRRRYDPHVREINEFVDALRKQHPAKFIPYVAPTYGGNNSRLLALLSDPGPATNPQMNGSELLCIENDDGTATRYKMYMRRHGIDVCDIQAWNAFPWYVSPLGRYQPGRPKRYPEAEVYAATEALATMVGLLPKLRVVLLHGETAKNAWERLRELRPASAKRARLVIRTYHTSETAIRDKTEGRVRKIENDLDHSFAKAAAALRGDIGAPQAIRHTLTTHRTESLSDEPPF